MNKILPVKEDEYFELRFHSIGGQGAYTIGQMLATIATRLPNIKSTVFASYGSEKKGAPVDVYVRLLESKKKISNYSAVREPNVVVVFHESLLTSKDVLNGIKDDGLLIINTDLSGQEIVSKYHLKIENIICIDANKIAYETKSKPNTVMFGAIIKHLNFIDQKSGIEIIDEVFKYRYAHLIESNIEAYERGFNESYVYEVSASEEELVLIKNDLGYENQYEGGLIRGVNSYKVNRGIARVGSLPEFSQDKCINCTRCDSTCPDDCFIWEEREGRRGRMEMVLLGIDYQACKGCLRCVEICPTEALAEIVEKRGFAESVSLNRERNFIK